MRRVESEEALRLLIAEIIVQAVEDYKYLTEIKCVNGKRITLNGSAKRLGRSIRKKDVTGLIEFFWGDSLGICLKVCRSNISRDAIVRKMQCQI